jgi:tRNA pseudouridine38-40 synthase
VSTASEPRAALRGHVGSSPNRFGNFFNHVDNFADEAFLFVTSGGIPATKSAGGKTQAKETSIDAALGSEIDEGEVRHGEGEEG